MSSQIFLGQTDRLPVVRAQLLDGDDDAIDLTDTTVTFDVRLSESSTLAIPCSVDTPATSGWVRFEPPAALTASRGTFPARYRVMDGSGAPLHVPNTGKIDVVVS